MEPVVRIGRQWFLQIQQRLLQSVRFFAYALGSVNRIEVEGIRHVRGCIYKTKAGGNIWYGRSVVFGEMAWCRYDSEHEDRDLRKDLADMYSYLLWMMVRILIKLAHTESWWVGVLYRGTIWCIYCRYFSVNEKGNWEFWKMLS